MDAPCPSSEGGFAHRAGAGVTVVLLVRHGEAQAMTGTTAVDPPLTRKGQEQAARLARCLAEGGYGTVDAIVSSTMRRARETAATLADALGLQLSQDERLVEIDHGWTSYGLGIESYPTRQLAFDALSNGRWGENVFDPQAFGDRVESAVTDAVAAVGGGNVAVVCHGAVISAYMARVLALDRLMFLAPDPCSVSRVLVQDDGYRELLSANEGLHTRR